mmetsp:Transcript_11822/g.27903  ORF Transcript_11822/g.27903 Transcript_11822/m.27903 type:complete len:202 (+) Transcript_11822:1248-1853(+)
MVRPQEERNSEGGAGAAGALVRVGPVPGLHPLRGGGVLGDQPLAPPGDLSFGAADGAAAAGAGGGHRRPARLSGLDDISQLPPKLDDAHFSELLHAEGERLGAVQAAGLVLLVPRGLHSSRDCDRGLHPHRLGEDRAKANVHLRDVSQPLALREPFLPELHGHAVGDSRSEPHPVCEPDQVPHAAHGLLGAPGDTAQRRGR